MKLAPIHTFGLPLIALTLGLTACGDTQTPAEQSGTIVEESDEWVATPDEEGAVNVDLPETPVEMATPDAEAMPETGATPLAE